MSVVTRIRTSQEVTVPFPPEEVWNVLADIAEYPSWWPAKLAVEILHHPGELLGAELEVRPLMGRMFRFRFEELENRRSMRLRFFGGSLEGPGGFHLREADGATDVRFEMDVFARGLDVAAMSLVLPLESFHRARMRSVLNSLAARLKALGKASERDAANAARLLEREAAIRQAAEEAAARRRVEEEAAARIAAEEAKRRAAVEEEAARRAVEEETRKRTEAEAAARAAVEGAERRAAEEAAARRVAEEEARKKGEEEAAARAAAEEMARRAAEEEAARRAVEKEARKKAEAEAAARAAAEEAERLALEEETARRVAEEEARKKAEEEAAAHAAAEEAERRAVEEGAARRVAEEEATKKAEEEAAARAAAEEVARRAAEEEAARRAAEEDARKKTEAEAAARAAAEEAERRAVEEETALRVAEEEVRKKSEEEAAARAAAEEAARRAAEAEAARRAAAEEERKRVREEAARAAEEDARRREKAAAAARAAVVATSYVSGEVDQAHAENRRNTGSTLRRLWSSLGGWFTESPAPVAAAETLDQAQESPRETNFEIARRYLAVLSGGAAPDEIAGFFAPEAVDEEFPHRFRETAVTRDFAGILEARATALARFTSQRYELAGATGGGSSVAMEVRWKGTVATTGDGFLEGQELDAGIAVFLKFAGGRIVRQRMYPCFEPWSTRAERILTLDDRVALAGRSTEAALHAPAHLPLLPQGSNFDIARRYLEALGSRTDAETIARYYAADAVQDEFPNRFLAGGAHRDLLAIKLARSRGLLLMASESYELLGATGGGSQVALEVGWSGVVGEGMGLFTAGQRLEARLGIFLKFRDGLIVTQRNYDCV